MSPKRLSPEKWLEAGLAALREEGPATLGAEPLARALKTTKGSFYWHFKDVPAYHAALVAHWQATALVGLATARETGDPADRALRDLGRMILSDRAEPALRGWSRSLPGLAAALAEVDAARLDYLQDLLRALGLGNPGFGVAMQAALVGLPQLSTQDTATRQATFDTLIDTVLALA